MQDPGGMPPAAMETAPEFGSMVGKLGPLRLHVIGLPFPPEVDVGSQIMVPAAHRQSVVIRAVAIVIGAFFDGDTDGLLSGRLAGRMPGLG